MERNRRYIVNEVVWNEARFYAKMAIQIGAVLVLLQVLFFWCLSAVFGGEKMTLTRQYVTARFAQAFTLDPSFDVTVNGKEFPGVPASRLVRSSEVTHAASSQLPLSILLFLVSCSSYALAVPYLRYLKRRATKLESQEYISGAKIVPQEELDRMIKEDGYPQRIPIAGFGLPVDAETRHGICVATSGSGKTQLMLPMLQAMRDMGAKAIVHVPKGDYLAKFYDPSRDFILNPLDERCSGWSLFNEIKTVPDIQLISASLIPPSGGTGAAAQDPFWNNAARDVFSGILYRLYSEGATTNADVWRAITSEAEIVANMLKDTRGGEAGYTYIQDASGKQALGVLATMMQFVRGFEFLADADGPFCISDWLRDGKPGFIFVTNYEDIKDTLRPILSLFIDLFGKRLLSMPEDRNRRVFIMLDEFGSLQRLSSIVDLQTKARSYGGGVWTFIQDNGQLNKIYGRETAQTLMNSANSQIVLSVPDSDTARYWSDRIGQTEFYEYELTTSFGIEDGKDGGSIRKVRKVEAAVKASDLSNLPDLTGYARIPRPLKVDGTPHDAGYPFAKIKIPLTKMPDLVPSFVMKQNWDLDKVFAVQREQDALSRLLQSVTGQGHQTKDQEQEIPEQPQKEQAAAAELEKAAKVKDDLVVDFMDL